jgi:hypothetical protein
VNNLNVGVEDYKAESELSTLKPVASWSQEKDQQEVVIEERSSTSAYVPPSQRRMDSAKAMPSVAEAATRLSATSSKAVPASTGPTPTRLKLITAASKKAVEEEERKKREEEGAEGGEAKKEEAKAKDTEREAAAAAKKEEAEAKKAETAAAAKKEEAEAKKAEREAAAAAKKEEAEANKKQGRLRQQWERLGGMPGVAKGEPPSSCRLLRGRSPCLSPGDLGGREVAPDVAHQGRED